MQPDGPMGTTALKCRILGVGVILAMILAPEHLGPAAPTVIDSASSISAANRLTSFTVSKTSGQVTSLKLGATPFVSESGTRGYFSANVGDIGVSGSTYWEMGFAGTTTSYTTGSDFVDVALFYPASAT